MANIEVMRGRLDEIEAEYRSIHTAAGEDALSADQQTRWDELDAEAAEVRQNIVKAEEDEARAQRVAASRARWGSVQVAESRTDAFDLNAMRGM